MQPEEVRSYIAGLVADRADTSQYVDRYLSRQWQVNEEVFKFIDDLLPEDPLVIDPCAGPQGSMVAALARGYWWIGNDVSVTFTRNRSSTPHTMHIVSDFHQSAFAPAIADATVFVFALNNLDTEPALIEAKRITKTGGIIVSASPGPGVWISNIVASDIIESEFPKYFRAKVFQKDIPQYFAELPYSQSEYVDYYLKYKLGITREILKETYKEFLSSHSRGGDVVFEMQDIISTIYFQNVSRNAVSNGLFVEQLGMLVLGKDPKTQSWNVHPVQSVSSLNELDGQFIDLRHSRGEIHKQLPEHLQRASTRMVVPVHIFRKP